MKEIVQLMMAGAGSLGFAILYNIRGKKLWVIAAGGIAAWGVYLATQQLTGNDYASSFTACVALTLYAEVMAIIFRTPVTVFLVSVAIPLIPGAPLYRAMNSLMHGSVEDFAREGTYAFLFAATMAAGITLTTLVFRTMRAKRYHRRHL